MCTQILGTKMSFQKRKVNRGASLANNKLAKTQKISYAAVKDQVRQALKQLQPQRRITRFSAGPPRRPPVPPKGAHYRRAVASVRRRRNGPRRKGNQKRRGPNNNGLNKLKREVNELMKTDPKEIKINTLTRGELISERNIYKTMGEGKLPGGKSSYMYRFGLLLGTLSAHANGTFGSQALNTVKIGPVLFAAQMAVLKSLYKKVRLRGFTITYAKYKPANTPGVCWQYLSQNATVIAADGPTAVKYGAVRRPITENFQQFWKPMDNSDNEFIDFDETTVAFNATRNDFMYIVGIAMDSETAHFDVYVHAVVEFTECILV